VLWGIALTGIVFKVFFVHRFDRASLLAYLGMGWLSVLIIKDMLHALDPAALVLIVLGGVLYTVGTIFYAKKSPLHPCDLASVCARRGGVSCAGDWVVCGEIIHNSRVFCYVSFFVSIA
jgi:predicted membrane channel-forming protein YqfA (hemolysin III family)